MAEKIIRTRTQKGGIDTAMPTRVSTFICNQGNQATPRSPHRVCIQCVLARVRHFLLVGIGALALISAGGIGTQAQAQSLEEHDAKAAFVLKLVNFVQW